MIRDDSHLKNILLLICISVVFLIIGNNLLSLTNPDEVFYSLSAKEMVRQKTWLVPYIFGEPQFEKPILTFWLLRLSFCLFGITAFAARFPPALFGVLGGLAVYYLCQLAYGDKKKSFLCSLILVSSGLYIGLSRFVLTDMIFSIFILFSLVAFYAGYVRPQHKNKGIVLFFVFSALAVLTKGLLGVVLPAAVVLLFLTLERNWKFIFGRTTLYGVIIFLLLALPWYVFMVREFGHGFIHEFFYNDHIRRILEAEHSSNDTWYFYVLVMILGMLPWSIFVVAALGRLIKQCFGNGVNPIYRFLLSWIVTMFVVLEGAHSKLASYIFPLMLALPVITVDYISMLREKNKNRTLLTMIILSSFLLLGVAFALFLISSGHLLKNFHYYEYLPHNELVDGLFVLALAVAGVTIFSALTKRQQLCFYLLSLQVPLLLTAGLFARDKFEDYVSSRHVCEYLLANRKIDNRILCSKMFVRGVRYYTDKETAVVGGQFFSPHPIPTLDREEDILNFLKDQGVTYAIVRKGQLKKIRQASKNLFEVKELLHAGDAHVLQITRM